MKRPLSKLKSKRVQSKRALPAAAAAGLVVGAAATALATVKGPEWLKELNVKLASALEKRAP